jgi:hypothetical protein
MSGADGHADLIRAIKNAVDPNGVLAPGRYEPAENRRCSKVTASHE